jgi:hypothetical protein
MKVFFSLSIFLLHYKNPTKRIGPVQSRHHHISLHSNLFSSWFWLQHCWIFAKQQSPGLTLLHPICSCYSLVLYICFVDRCLSFCTFSFGHCVVCSTSIYGFRLPLWYLQTLLTHSNQVRRHSQVTEQIGCNKGCSGKVSS